MRTRVLEHRNQSEDQSRSEGKNQREPQHPGVDRDIVQARQMRNLRSSQQAQCPKSQAEPECAPREAEQRAFQQQLASDPPPARAQRRADRQFLLPSVGANQQQIRHIGARNQQHHAHRAHQHPQRIADVAYQVVLQPPQVRADPG